MRVINSLCVDDVGGIAMRALLSDKQSQTAKHSKCRKLVGQCVLCSIPLINGHTSLAVSSPSVCNSVHMCLLNLFFCVRKSADYLCEIVLP